MKRPDNIRNALILAVETSSRVGSAALALGPQLLSQTTLSGPMRHSDEILPAIEQLLGHNGYASNRIDHIYISIGPGSFTGLRIGVAMAKAMHLANNTQIVGVDSLDVITSNVIDLFADRANSLDPGLPAVAPEAIVVPVLDAKRGQFFAAAYRQARHRQTPGDDCNHRQSQTCRTDRARWRKMLEDCLTTPDDLFAKLVAPSGPVWLLGDGLLGHQDKFKRPNVRFFEQRYWSGRAAQVHAIGYAKACDNDFADPLSLTPFYLRGPQVTLKRL